MQKLLTFFQQKYKDTCHQSLNDMLTKCIVNFEQLGPRVNKSGHRTAKLA